MRVVLEISETEKAAIGVGTADRLVHMWNQQLTLFLDKNSLYKDAWREQGWRGNVARILSKASRIKHMLWGSMMTWQDADEPVEDTLRDLSLLCMFALMNREQRNEWGPHV